MRIYSANINLFAAFITGCFFLCGCENDINAIKDLDAKKTAVEEAKKVVVNYSIGGVRKAILISPLMYRVQDTVPYVEFPTTIHVDFYSEKNNDSIESRLDSRY